MKFFIKMNKFPQSLILGIILCKMVLCNESCLNFVAICVEKSNCRDCIRAHHCCEWCYDQSLTIMPRCITKSNSNECDSNYIERNSETSSTIIKQVDFTDVETDVDQAIQFKPQEFNIKLRYGEAINVTLTYRPAKDYPLDLYYLMDLTKSMEPDLQTLTILGTKLTTLLQNLTQNYRIAFGSYIDKPEMPFYQTDPLNKENPCRLQSEICQKAYLFKHRLNFTRDIDTFIQQVKNSGLSANADDPEGGIDAVMQIVLCKQQLGWSEKSRKLILMATEGTLHFAGDGLLAGYTKRDVNQCHVDVDGNYNSKESNDYPSLEEVFHQLKQNKINIIVAAKSNVNDYYKNMAELINEAMFVGELEKESKNVLTLVEQGYEAFAKKVNLFVPDVRKIHGLNVDFFADCNSNGNWIKTHSCSEATQGKEMHFKIQFSLNEYQTSNSEVIYIEESNIHEKIKINLEFVCSNCKCNSLNKTNQPNKCIHGEMSCGECLCNDGWSGPNCSQECTNNYNKCRYIDDDGIVSLTCSGRGECICSKCVCDSEQFQGNFCEFQCPIDKATKQICNGQGDCINSTCICRDGYSGATCSCHESNESCTIPGTKNICSGKGVCKCDECQCFDGFSDRFCEKCETCNGLCDHYKSFVLNNKTHVNVRIETVENLSEDKRTCFHQYESNDGKLCNIYYDYNILEKNQIKITRTKEICTTPLTAGFFIGIIMAVFIALIGLIIIIWKARNMYLDKKEYNEFLLNKSKSQHSEMNPLYKSPVTTYHLPVVEMNELHNKID